MIISNFGIQRSQPSRGGEIGEGTTPPDRMTYKAIIQIVAKLVRTF